MLAPNEIAQIEEVDADEIEESIHDRLTPVHVIMWDVESAPDRPSNTEIRVIKPSLPPQSRVTILPSLPPPRSKPQPPRNPSSQEVLEHIWYVGEEDLIIDTDKEVLTAHEQLFAQLWEGASVEGTRDEEDIIATDWFANPKLRR